MSIMEALRQVMIKKRGEELHVYMNRIGDDGSDDCPYCLFSGSLHNLRDFILQAREAFDVSDVVIHVRGPRSTAEVETDDQDWKKLETVYGDPCNKLPEFIGIGPYWVIH